MRGEREERRRETVKEREGAMGERKGEMRV